MNMLKDSQASLLFLANYNSNKTTTSYLVDWTKHRWALLPSFTAPQLDLQSQNSQAQARKPWANLCCGDMTSKNFDRKKPHPVWNHAHTLKANHTHLYCGSLCQPSTSLYTVTVTTSRPAQPSPSSMAAESVCYYTKDNLKNLYIRWGLISNWCAPKSLWQP